MDEKFVLHNDTPENLGISSEDVAAMLNDFEENGLFMHSFMLLRHGKIAAEGYYKPFKPDMLHRMYSISKTFASAAIGLLCDEGKISLTDKVHKFFPDKCPKNLHPYIADATIRDLLIMATPFHTSTYCMTSSDDEWNKNCNDWAWTFFNAKPDHPAGTVFLYDTSGSYILDVIVERVTGMPFLTYMRDRLFKYIDFSENTWCVKSPEGNSWGGSGVMCTTRDLAKFALVFLNKGRINGRQLISEEYVTAATTRQIDNNAIGHEKNRFFGYGYQIWITKDNSFSFLGMGDQLAICIPEKDFLFVCTADNQGSQSSRKAIYDALWKHIVDKLESAPLPKNDNAYNALLDKISKLELFVPLGDKHSDTESEINGITYNMNENPMEISKIRLELLKDYGKLCYTNPRGDKEILFGYGEYKDGFFPETHYFGDTIKVSSDRPYRCLASGVWTEKHKLVIKVNVIDDYFGNLAITLSYKGNELGVSMQKTAEWFLDEYQGFAGGTKVH